MYLVCGEALFDVFDVSSADSPANTLRLDAIAGGSPFNVAIGLRRLGVASCLLGGISRDSLGKRLRHLLESEGVGTPFLRDYDAPTTLAMVTLDETGQPQYDFRGEGCADRLLDAAELPLLGDDVAGIHFGSYSLVVEPIGSALLELATREQGRRLITLDPNIRLNVEPDLQRWRDRIEAFAALANVIKVSDEDLERLYPETPLADTAQRWLQGGCVLAIVTRGAQGSLVFTNDAQWTVDAHPVTVQDTVGAGDTFQAALIAYLTEIGKASPAALASLSRPDIDRMLMFASAASAITCSRKGPDLPHRSDVDALLAGRP
ncbi:carbohydrate kinase family protein [Pseudomonas matsuisoli]|uniref:Fructokinase n=1 Tax=Pseudomonas matsuisoli TaxID=1515666 RepID=A0A917PNN7_9PSED|nr:carbohydrate kinase [Pseudomonas matsuisoli]GGJ86009.1 fructokinase [Pseudomonas matsuisoli]